MGSWGEEGAQLSRGRRDALSCQGPSSCDFSRDIFYMDPKGAYSSFNPQVIHGFAHPIHSVPHPAGEKVAGRRLSSWWRPPQHISPSLEVP